MAVLFQQLVRNQIQQTKFPYTHRRLAEHKILEPLRCLRVEKKG